MKAWIEKDGRRVSSSSSFFGNSKASLVFNNGYTVKKGDKLNLVVSLSGDAGSELSFKVDNVSSTAKNTTVSPDTTGVFRTTTYSVTSLSFVSHESGNRTYNITKDAQFSFGEFKLQNDSPAKMEKDVLIKTITFKVNDGDVKNLSEFKMLRDGKELKTTYTVEGRNVTFVMNDTLESGKSSVYKVVATPVAIENADGDKYSFEIKKGQDIIAQEVGANGVGYRAGIVPYVS